MGHWRQGTLVDSTFFDHVVPQHVWFWRIFGLGDSSDRRWHVLICLCDTAIKIHLCYRYVTIFKFLFVWLKQTLYLKGLDLCQGFFCGYGYLKLVDITRGTAWMCSYLRRTAQKLLTYTGIMNYCCNRGQQLAWDLREPPLAIQDINDLKNKKNYTFLLKKKFMLAAEPDPTNGWGDLRHLRTWLRSLCWPPASTDRPKRNVGHATIITCSHAPYYFNLVKRRGDPANSFSQFTKFTHLEP